MGTELTRSVIWSRATGRRAWFTDIKGFKRRRVRPAVRHTRSHVSVLPLTKREKSTARQRSNDQEVG